jgi:cytochrome c5
MKGAVTMRRTLAGALLAGLVTITMTGVPGSPARAQQSTPEAAASPCQGVAADPARMSSILPGVARYGSTYVLIVPQRLAEKAPNAAAPGVRELEVGVQSGSEAADAARAIGITKIREYPFSTATAIQPLQDMAGGKLDAAVMWGPLAGLGILELGLDEQVVLFSIDRPHPAPSAFTGSGQPGPCADAIRDELDVSGVLPAELLVGVELRDLLGRKPPVFNLEQAREGGVVFNASCARCHGGDAIADPHGLAPVDLRISIRRFSFPGFNYIVLNGRPAKSMPPFRGTVSDDQIRLIYQYLKARSDNLLPGQATPSAATTTTPSNGGN